MMARDETHSEVDVTETSLTYRAILAQAKDGITVTFPEWPEAITCGHDIADALFHARDCLAEAIADRMRRGESFPDFVEPEPGQHLVAVDPEDVLTLADPADGGEHGEGEPSDPK